MTAAQRGLVSEQVAVARGRLATVQAAQGLAGRFRALVATVGVRFRAPPPATPLSPPPTGGGGGGPAPVVGAPATGNTANALFLAADLYDPATMQITFAANGGTPGGPWTIIANPSAPSSDGAVSVTGLGSFVFDQDGYGGTTIPVVPGPSPWYAAVDLTTGAISAFVQAPPGAVVPLSIVPGPDGTVFAVSGGSPGGAYNVLATPPPPAFSPANASVVATGIFDENGNGSFAITDIYPGDVFYNARDTTTGATALGWYESAVGTVTTG
jgi:hypothetical protein